MSHTLLVSWRCDWCGLQVETTTFSAPVGWLKPTGLGDQAGPHLCQECAQRALQAPSNLVPVESRRVG